MSPQRLLMLGLAVGMTVGCQSSPREARATDKLPPAPPVAPAVTAAAPADAPAASLAKAQATTAPSVEPITVAPPEPVKAAPKSAAEAFDAQLIALVRNEPPSDATVGEIPEDDKELLRSVIDSLTSFRMTLKQGSALRMTKVTPLLDLSERIRAEIPLAVPTLALCRSVTQFGVYEPFEPARFTAGKETPLVIYCEVDHFRSAPAIDGRWETKLTYEAVLYNDGQAGVAVINKKPTPIVDRCRNRRRDFFLADRMTLPANLPVGQYVL
jgi:hypothetical protein